MAIGLFADRRWLTSRLSRDDAHSNLRIHVVIFAVSLIWLAVVYGAACIDGSRELPTPGKGFTQHHGYIIFHLMTPIALSLSLLSHERFARILQKPEPHFLRSMPGSKQFNELRAEHLSSLNLHSRFTLILLLGVATGALCATLIFKQVIAPMHTYGNDVFNSVRYPFGYYTANSYLAVAYILIIPFSLYTVLHITISTALLLREARKLGVLKVDLFHADNCGGLSDFGDLNLLLTLYYAPLVISLLALAGTHVKRYASLLLPASILPMVLITQALVGVLVIYNTIQTEKRRRLAELNPILNGKLDHPAGRDDASISALLLWHHIRKVYAMPYTDGVRYAQALLPLLSLAVGVVQVALIP